MSILPLKGDLQEYHSGVLHKVGGKVKTWNKRFFILKSDYCLYYYKDTSKGPLGSISLQDQHFKVRKGEPGDVSWPRQTKMDCTMAIVTSYRTYCFYSDYSHEIIEWIEMLTKAREKWRKKSLTESKSVSSSSIGHTEQQGKMTLGDRVLGLPSEENMNHSKTDEVTSTEALYTFAKPEEVDQPLYEDVGTEKNAENAILYEQITPDDEASNAPVQQPLYDDVHPSNAEHVQDDNTPSPPLRNDPAQPLYDDVHPSQTHADDIAPLLPPRNDIKPAPSLPPRNDSAQPLYDDVHPSQTEDGDITPSPLPPTDDPHIDDDLAPSLPPRDISPLSPRGTIDPYNFVPSPSGTPPSQLTPPSPHNTLPFTLELTPPTQGSPPDSYETPPPSHETLPLPAEGMPHTPTSDGSTDTGSPSSQPTRPVPKPRVKRESDTAEGAEDNDTCPVKEQGLLLFQMQKKRLNEYDEGKQRAESIRVLEDIATDPAVSSDKRITFAETLREVEQEKQLASEERFKWERERRRLEEERLQLEEEKRKLQEEMQKARLLLDNK